jgi:hypothetical protein
VPTRSFTSPTGGEAVSFDIDGEVFHCIERLPAGYSLDLLTRGNQALPEFYDLVLVPEDVERFTARIRDKERVVTMAVLEDITRWLVGVYTGRPTGPPSASATGDGPTAMPSTPAA